MSDLEKEKYSANSLVRGLEILKLFNADNPTLSLSEISKSLGVSRTVPYRLLYTLQSMGYLDQDENTKRYSLNPKVLEIGFAYLNSLKLPEIAQPYIEKLRDELGTSCHLSILDGQEVVYIGTAPVRNVSIINVNIGTRLPAQALANGRVLLAYQQEERLMDKLKSLDAGSTATKDITTFQKELEVIRKQGYALTEGDFLPGVHSAAAPIFDYTGSIKAALNVVASEPLFHENFLEKVALPKVVEAAKELSGHLGYKK
ncbi:MAG TPA: HTH domain-containing protein [Bacillus bacterium]|uniref:IclR family transcriptional regulator n=1 Tax=Siminovitchia fordii TaxID=254759 RepID=A0ABQ4K3W7_9BACI|nr:IclR family transcriptional regulator C-terminal domain-containing protein [Siminovitchia fordii]GIN20423.1 IclR family transcriptional regulator [Siminovitchia fordii]HBZ08344.1 HTH domain-containing protein [Bacillus sp. (in: firmicutes)]